MTIDKACVVIAATVLASTTLAFAGDTGLGKGDSVVGLMVAYSSPGGDVGDVVDPAAAVGVDYYYHLTKKFGLGAGIASYSYDGSDSGGDAYYRETDDREFKVLSFGPIARFVFNPDSSFRAYVGGGVTYSRSKYHENYTYEDYYGYQGFTIDVTSNQIGLLVGAGFEASLSSSFFLGAEARYVYFGSDDVLGETLDASQVALALRLGFKF